MIITIPIASAVTLKSLISSQEILDAIEIKENDVKYSILIQNDSPNDVYFDTLIPATIVDGGVIPAGESIAMELFSLEDLQLIAGVEDTDVRLIIL